MKKFAVATAAVALLLTTSACGGNSRPSQDDLANAMKKGSDQVESLKAAGVKLDDKTYDCMAKTLHDSKVSDKALNAIVDQDKDYKPSDADEKAMEKMAPEFIKCVPGMADLQKQLGDLDPEKLQEQLDGLTESK